MELRQLDYLVSVVDSGSFTRAAELMHVTQPGVSTQVRRLERELGHVLLDRSGRTVRPTEAGAAMLPYARAARDAVAGARRVLDELSGLVRGDLTLVASGLPASVDLPRLLAGYRQRHPRVDVTLSVGSAEEVLDGLSAGRFDAGFAGLWDESPPWLASLCLSTQRIVAVVDRHDPLAVAGATTLADVARRDIVCLPVGTGLRATVDRAFALGGFTPRVALEASAPQVLVRLAGFGLGVALVPESSVALAGDEPVAVLPIADGAGLRTRFGLVWRRAGPLGPAARAFVDHVTASAGTDT